MVSYKKKQPTKSPRIAVTAAPSSAGNQSFGSVSRSTRRQQRLQNLDTASLAASAWTVSEAIVNGDLSEKSNEDYDNSEEEKDGDQGEDSNDEDNEADGTNETEGEDQANRFEGLVDSSLLEDDVPSHLFCVPCVHGQGAGRKPKKGRPPHPDTNNMTEKQAEMAIKKW